MSDTSTEPNSQGGIMTERRRKRVNRLKALIIILAVLLLILPTVFCIILGIQVSRLQKQMKELVDLHSEYGLTYDNGNEKLAYAAEKPLSEILNTTDSSSGQAASTVITANPGDGNTADNNTTSGETITAFGGTTGSDSGSLTDIITDPAGAVSANTGAVSGIADDSAIAGSDGTQTGNTVTTDAGVTDATNAGDTVAKDTGDTGATDAGNTVATDAGDTAAAETGNADGTGIAIVTPAAGSVINPTDSGSPYAVVADMYKGKNVYLTFDDGPSIYTGEILDILAEYNVKATFFVIGKTDKASKKLYQRIVDEGHTLGMHSYSHNYDIIYNSAEDFDKDFTKLWKLLYDTTGYKPFLYRFPGGSNNKVNKYGMEEFIRYLNQSSITYFDWNVVNGDATGIQYTKEQLIANVLNGVAEKKNPIVLMHDARSKKTTVESLPGLLDQLILGGAQILPLDKDVKPIQMIKADSIK